MPYTLRFYLYLLVSGVVALVGADLLSPLGLTFNIAFALIAGYLGIIVGRWVLGVRLCSIACRSFGGVLIKPRY